MSKLYVLVFTEFDMLIDFKIFGEFDEALKEYIGYSTQETRKLLVDESDTEKEDLDSKGSDDEAESEDKLEKVSVDEDDITCKLQIQDKAVDSSEYVVTKEFDIDYFLENVVNDKDDLKDYLNNLENIVCGDDPVPEDILGLFK